MTARRLGARLGVAILCAGLMLGLAGCGEGDTGPAGPAGSPGASGPPGPPGPTGGTTGATTATGLTATITGVTIGSPPTVDFRMSDQDGAPFVGLQPGQVRFTIAKLIPGANGDTDHWQNYINRLEKAGSVGPGTEDKVQANSAGDSAGTLVNNGDGTYRYTFATDITNVTDPIAVTFDPALPHRVGMQTSGGLPVANATLTFQPSTGRTDVPQRQLIKLASCNECHGRLALHGGSRIDTKYCVVCHNPGSADANSGNSLDFRVMIHKIHDGENLPSVEAGGEYAIYGFRDTKLDFSDVAFPQNVRNCTKCHNPDDPETPDAQNIVEHPSIQACGACHDDVDFAKGIDGGHPGGVVTDNSQCTVCHAPDRIAGGVLESHTIGTKVAAAKFKYNILEVKNTAPGEFPEIRFSVTDPTNNDAPYNIKSDPPFTAGGGASRLALDIAWSTTDYTNTGSGRAPSQAVSLDALAASADNGDGTFTVTSTVAIPADVTGSGTVGFEGHPAADLDGDGNFTDRVPVKSEVKFFAITDSTPAPRRDVVDVENCQKCHGQNDGLSLHGGNRTDNVQLCVLCHNPNDTDLSRRPADPDATDNNVNTAAADGLEEQGIDFKRMIHAIHGADFRAEQGAPDFIIYGFGGSVNDFADVGFPGILNNCLTCHKDKTFELPLKPNVLATTVDTKATVISSSPLVFSDAAAASDPSDDGNITPTAAVCSACHGGELALAHMGQNGGSFDARQSDIDNGAVIEACPICHEPGRIADVRVVHGIQ